jgi:hypothetical protein
MRFIHYYLIGYFTLLMGAGLALWQAGVLARVSGIWLAISALFVVGLGILLAVSSGRPLTDHHQIASGDRARGSDHVDLPTPG